MNVHFFLRAVEMLVTQIFHDQGIEWETQRVVKSFLTHAARVRFLLIMCLHVCAEITLDIECLFADIASERFRYFMRPHVYGQGKLIRKYSCAFVASVRLFSVEAACAVCVVMCGQGRCTRKSFPTFIASVKTSIACLHVCG